jgi:hypothetical protein
MMIIKKQLVVCKYLFGHTKYFELEDQTDIQNAHLVAWYAFIIRPD